MSDSLEPIPDPDQQLARQGATQPGSLLRLRDVQALNRSFRRLAEVQEALLDRLETLEEEKVQQSRWNGPLMAIVGIVLGLGMALIAFVMWQKQEGGESQQQVVLQQEPAVVNVPTPEVTVLAPDNKELAEALDAMNANMAEVFAQQKADREALGELTEKLLLSEEEKLRLMQEFAQAEEQYRQDLASQEPVKPVVDSRLQVPNGGTTEEASAATPPDLPQKTWVAVVNGLLAADGYSSLRLQRAERIQGQAALSGVTWMSWNTEGLVESIIHADRLTFEMHRMTGNLVLRFFDGSRTANGLRTVLPRDGLRLDLDSRTLDAWLEHFPELKEATVVAQPGVIAATDGNAPSATGTQPPANTGSNGTLRDARKVRKALDDLISPRGSFSYYRLSALDAVEGRTLRLVQINWHDNSGRLVKTIEADTLEVLLHGSNSVELLLRNGAFLDGGVKSPFSSDRFSLHLPRQDLQAWRDSGVPYTEVES
ncbi:MAG: hypothetical protein ACPG31_08915 [Planctomycetota bacterium]